MPNWSGGDVDTVREPNENLSRRTRCTCYRECPSGFSLPIHAGIIHVATIAIF
jgi:hypothetical protein